MLCYGCHMNRLAAMYSSPGTRVDSVKYASVFWPAHCWALYSNPHSATFFGSFSASPNPVNSVPRNHFTNGNPRSPTQPVWRRDFAGSCCVSAMKLHVVMRFVISFVYPPPSLSCPPLLCRRAIRILLDRHPRSPPWLRRRWRNAPLSKSKDKKKTPQTTQA